MYNPDDSSTWLVVYYIIIVRNVKLFFHDSRIQCLAITLPLFFGLICHIYVTLHARVSAGFFGLSPNYVFRSEI